MFSDWTSARVVNCARALAIAAMILGVVALPTACTQGGNGSGCVAYVLGTVFEIDETSTVGFDDRSSSGTLMAVAIDANEAMGAPISALVIAVQFPLLAVPSARDFSPTCDTTVALDSYTHSQTNTATAATASAPATSFVATALTDTAGIIGMTHTMNALLILDSNPDRYFIAVSGTVNVVRDDGSMPTMATVTGELNFVELDISGAGFLDETAVILDGGEIRLVENINFTVNTTVQP
jgi:hypothetical protein